MAGKKEKKLTPQQVKKIVEEVNVWNGKIAYLYKVKWVTYLWELPGECYQVYYENGACDVFKCDPHSQKLRGVISTTYYGPHWTNNPRFGQPDLLEEELEKPQQEE